MPSSPNNTPFGGQKGVSAARLAFGCADGMIASIPRKILKIPRPRANLHASGLIAMIQHLTARHPGIK
jgi:hypothetical protein